MLLLLYINVRWQIYSTVTKPQYDIQPGIQKRETELVVLNVFYSLFPHSAYSSFEDAFVMNYCTGYICMT